MEGGGGAGPRPQPRGGPRAPRAHSVFIQPLFLSPPRLHTAARLGGFGGWNAHEQSDPLLSRGPGRRARPGGAGGAFVFGPRGLREHAEPGPIRAWQ